MISTVELLGGVLALRVKHVAGVLGDLTLTYALIFCGVALLMVLLTFHLKRSRREPELGVPPGRTWGAHMPAMLPALAC